MRLVKTVGGVFFLVHLMACLWFLIAKLSDFQPNSWAVQKGLVEEHPLIQYLVSVYWAFQTVTTVGFGDIAIALPEEFCFSLLWMIFGVSFYSFTVGNVSTIIANMDTKAAILSNKLSILQTFSERIQLNQETSIRIQRHLENDSKDLNSIVEQDNLFQELPPSLRSEVIGFTHKSVVNKIAFFRDKNAEFLWKVLPLLKARKLYTTDILYSQADVAEEIYFVMAGDFTLYIDVSDKINLPAGTIDKNSEAFNVPYSLYV